MIIVHALRNAFIPTLTVLGLAFAWLMAGAIMTETIFAWPGIGRYAVEAASNLDYPAVLGTTCSVRIYLHVHQSGSGHSLLCPRPMHPADIDDG